MARMTKKYKGALAVASVKLKKFLMLGKNTCRFTDNKALYRALNAHNWYWNSKMEAWELGESAQKPTDLIRVRVWAATEVVRQAADDVAYELLNRNYELVERSEPYECRPPKQLESRIYLAFLPRCLG